LGKCDGANPVSFQESVRHAVTFLQIVCFAQPALVDGSVGIVVAPHGKLSRVLRFTIANGRFLQADIIQADIILSLRGFVNLTWRFSECRARLGFPPLTPEMSSLTTQTEE
jgi:hypothetical protein